MKTEHGHHQLEREPQLSLDVNLTGYLLTLPHALHHMISPQ